MVALTVFEAKPLETEKCLKEYCLACWEWAVTVKNKSRITELTSRTNAASIIISNLMRRNIIQEYFIPT
jgi:hypothetical protein